MNSLTRLGKVLTGLLNIVLAVVLIACGDDALQLVALLLAASLEVRGLWHLGYFATLARHMIGGLTQLFLGILLIDAGTFAALVMGRGVLYVCGYLVVVHAISGGLTVARAVDSRRLGGASWQPTLVRGIFDLAVCVVCVVFRHNPSTLVLVYAAGLIVSGLGAVASAVRREQVPYIY